MKHVPWQNCVYDSCNCGTSEDCMCAAVSAYVYACSEAGIHLKGWRSTICGERGAYFFLFDCGRSWCISRSISLPFQANTAHRARGAQYIATTWPCAIALASHLARRTTLARPLSQQWMAAAAVREHTWTRTRNVFRTRSALAITKTPSLRPERLLAKMATHGKHTADVHFGISLSE